MLSLPRAEAESGPPGRFSAASAGLLRLHRHSLMHVMVLGGTAEEREQVAFEFHRESPLRLGPFVVVDCVREESRLLGALECWMAQVSRAQSGNPLRAAARGTLYLDSIDEMSHRIQRALLTFADRFGCVDEGPDDAEWAGRLIVGSAADPAHAVAEGRFLAALYDHLDKIRVEMGPARHRGAA